MRLLRCWPWGGTLGLAMALTACGGGGTEPSGNACGNAGAGADAGNVSLAVGEQLIVQRPADLCLFFAGRDAAETYLIGVQSTSEVPASLTPIALTAVAEGAASAVPDVAAGSASGQARSTGQARSASALPDVARWAGHRQAEAQFRGMESRLFGSRPTSLLGPRSGPSARARIARSSVAASAAPGDMVAIRVPNITSTNSCQNFVEINAVVRFVGARGIWLEDVANPTPGYTTADFQVLSNAFDNVIYATDVAYFGEPTDIDSNGRTLIVITAEVNKFATSAGTGPLGFVSLTDFLPRTDPNPDNACASSDAGEIFYGLAPDPLGTLKFGRYSPQQGVKDTPSLIAHEFTHVIQFGRRLAAQVPLFTLWMAEGQAVLGEEVVGHATEGRAPGQNLGFTVAFNQDDPSSIDWYSYPFVTLVRYFGFDGFTADAKAPGAPQECTFLASPKPDTLTPCNEGLTVYSSWSLLRWLSDQYGATFPGGEQALHRALIDSPDVGYAILESVIGAPIETLLAQWSAMLYVDDRVPGVTPRLTLPSWNLFDILEQNRSTPALTPVSETFGNFTEAANVRAASTAYFLVSGASRPATVIRARTTAGGALPPSIQLYVVRLQ